MNKTKKSNKVQKAREELLNKWLPYKESGDVINIAKRLNYTNVYVSNCLSKNRPEWNDEIFSEYKKRVNARLKKLQLA